MSTTPQTPPTSQGNEKTSPQLEFLSAFVQLQTAVARESFVKDIPTSIAKTATGESG